LRTCERIYIIIIIQAWIFLYIACTRMFANIYLCIIIYINLHCGIYIAQVKLLYISIFLIFVAKEIGYYDKVVFIITNFNNVSLVTLCYSDPSIPEINYFFFLAEAFNFTIIQFFIITLQLVVKKEYNVRVR